MVTTCSNGAEFYSGSSKGEGWYVTMVEVLVEVWLLTISAEVQVA
jgi:hypothetical protein